MGLRTGTKNKATKENSQLQIYDYMYLCHYLSHFQTQHQLSPAVELTTDEKHHTVTQLSHNDLAI